MRSATGMFALQGLVSAAVLWRTLLFVPVLMLGVAIGHRLFGVTSQHTAKRIALVLLMALSAALFARSV